MDESDTPIGVVLAGGAGRRIGGAKATVELGGVPLIGYPVAALQAVLAEVVVVCKRDTPLPPLPGVAVWFEPDAPRHPLAGVVHALGQADGRPVFVCAGDLPFASAPLVQLLIDSDPGGVPAVVPRAGGLQPLFALYLPAARAPLAGALVARQPGALTEIVAALAPWILEIPDERPFFNVNAPEDLLTASALLDQGGASGEVG